MKVLVVSHLYPAPGHERHLFVHEQVRELARAGVEVHVISPIGFAPRALWRLDPRLRRRGLTPRQTVRDGITIEYPRVLALPRRALFAHSGALFDLTLRRLVPDLRARDFDLVHAHQAMPDGAAARRLAAALGIPYVVTVHGADVYQHLRNGGSVAAATRSVLAGARAVTAVSSAVARLLAPHVAPDRLFVVPNGTLGLTPVAPADFAPGVPLLFTAGYLIARKGHAAVLEALARLSPAAPGGAGDSGGDPRRETQWAIAGDGPLRDELAAEAGRIGLADRVHFLGRIPHDEVLAMMSRAELFVLASRDEAFGLVYTEAMAQGTPVVACAGEGAADFVEDGVSGFLVPPRDPAALAQVIGRVLDDPDGARRMGEKGRVAVTGLTWASNAARQKEIYDTVVGRGRPPAPQATST
jgi:teichuronic acid biosynthesis glycosyltransferase TuaC